MFTTFAVLFATAAAAQAASASASASASAASVSSTANPYIPTSASATCQAYLNQLDGDTDLASCTSALKTATAGFGPNGNMTNASKQQVTDTLTNICASSASACPQTLITSKLASFYTSCGSELTSSPIAEVKLIYDTFYTVLPFLSAICTKDNSGAWCVPQANTTSSSASPAVEVGRRDASTAAYMPDASTINSENILFLYTTPSLPKAQLCTDCTAAVLKSFMTFEAGTNYAPGLAQSTLLSGQPALYSAVTTTCGSDFLSGAVKAAGSLSQGGSTGTSAAPRTLRSGSALVAAFAAALGAVLLL